MPSAEERFRAKVVRRGGHELWTGARDRRGAGMVRIGGKLRTVQRAAWEFAYGPVPAGARVNSCAAERACVRIEHLSLSGGSRAAVIARSRRRAKRSGSLRQVSAGVWELAVSEGPTQSGRPRRRYLRVHGSRADAEVALERMVLVTSRRDLGDLRVGELVGRYFDWRADQRRGHDTGDRELAAWRGLDAHLGIVLAAFATPGDIERAARDARAGDVARDEVRDGLAVLRSAYRWAMRQGWTDEKSGGGGASARCVVTGAHADPAGSRDRCHAGGRGAGLDARDP